MEDKMTRDELHKYRDLTSNALSIAKNSIVKTKLKQANEIITMVSNYLSDAEYFESRGNFIDAFAAINYAHGWLDSGVRLGIFRVKDDKLFTVK